MAAISPAAPVASPTRIAPYSKEPPLFTISLIIGILFWVLVILGTLGVALLYIGLGFLVYLFAQSGFISYLKGNAVEVTTEQYPQLYQHYLTCCQLLGMQRIPRLYLLQSEGLVNALAARFLNTNYVVLYSSIVDALESNPESLRFYMGHELCHIQRGHLKWSLLVWPAKILPVLGPAYARAQESSCDRYGLACCGSLKDAVRAMAVIASGPEQWKKLNVRAFVEQSKESGRFWMSFHELTAGYPWLCKRVARIVGWTEDSEATFPRRHPFAWFVSIFVPNTGLGASGGPLTLIIMVAIIGILAAIAIPAYQDFTVRANVASSTSTTQALARSITEFVERERVVPADLAAVGFANTFPEGVIERIELAEDGSFTVVYRGNAVIAGKTIVYTPYLDDDKAIRWNCAGGSLSAKYRPASCRK